MFEDSHTIVRLPIVVDITDEGADGVDGILDSMAEQPRKYDSDFNVLYLKSDEWVDMDTLGQQQGPIGITQINT